MTDMQKNLLNLCAIAFLLLMVNMLFSITLYRALHRLTCLGQHAHPYHCTVPCAKGHR